MATKTKFSTIIKHMRIWVLVLWSLRTIADHFKQTRVPGLNYSKYK